MAFYNPLPSLPSIQLTVVLLPQLQMDVYFMDALLHDHQQRIFVTLPLVIVLMENPPSSALIMGSGSHLQLALKRKVSVRQMLEVGVMLRLTLYKLEQFSDYVDRIIAIMFFFVVSVLVCVRVSMCMCVIAK